MTRRALLRLLAAGTLAAARVAPAQDPRASLAAAAGRSWLELTDRMDSVASWSAAGERFRKAIDRDAWASALARERAPRGALLQRTLLGATLETQVPDLPPGEYALLQFRTSFANRVDGRETLTLERESDGTWRVIGYFIR